AFSPDGRRLAVGAADADTHVWDVDDDGVLRRAATFSQDSGEVWSLAFSRDGSRLVSAGSDRVVRIWDVATGRKTRLRELPPQPDEFLAAASAPAGRWLASAGPARTVRLWAAATGADGPPRAFDAHDRLDALAYSPDGRYLVAACGDAT